jgi:uncharacterized protein (DUF2126 family)
MPNPNRATAKAVERRLARLGIRLTLGGEPSYVPLDPSGAEWSIAALGPTKLAYAQAIADATARHLAPGGLTLFSPGKLYPGEVNPRWALHRVTRRDGAPVLAARAAARSLGLAAGRSAICRALGIPDAWHATDSEVWVLPLDHSGKAFQTGRWVRGRRPSITLTEASGPAGLRLPLADLGPKAIKRALVLEPLPDGLHVFLPPLLQGPWTELATRVAEAFDPAGIRWEGYLPPDDEGVWETISFSADPGVLEVNLPPCPTWQTYADWILRLDAAAQACGLCTFKTGFDGTGEGTGGGNHLLFGGPSPAENPLFRRPSWIASMLRFWQHHPSLSYLFTGRFVGPSSQAPRPDESGRDLADLEIACRSLEALPDGPDHRHLIGETLRHLHVDASGNTHRSEISFDKFWNPDSASGCRGLMEFRALETFPSPRWTNAVALLWRALALHLAERPFRLPLLDRGRELHDRSLLPHALLADLETILARLRDHRLPLDPQPFRELWDWRFPLLLATAEQPGLGLEIRRAPETWPLLCETPHEGGTTSRFVDASMERLEFVAPQALLRRCQVSVAGRPLPFLGLDSTRAVSGLRYRKSALYPSLHPTLPPQVPLEIALREGRKTRRWLIHPTPFQAVPLATDAPSLPAGPPCLAAFPGAFTHDLRL